MGHGFVYVDVLTIAKADLIELKVDLISETIVEVHRRKRIVVANPLLKACFERTCLFGLQTRIRQGGKAAAVSERFRKRRFLDAGGISEAQASTREQQAALRDQQS